jgi:hypothetical protein
MKDYDEKDEKELEKKRLKKMKIVGRVISLVGSLFCLSLFLYADIRDPLASMLAIISATLGLAGFTIMSKALKALEALSKNSAKDGNGSK